MDVYRETFASLPLDMREKFDSDLAALGLELASHKTRDAYWFDCSPHWLWVRKARVQHG